MQRVDAARRLFAHLHAGEGGEGRRALEKALRAAEAALRGEGWSWSFLARGAEVQRRAGAGRLRLRFDLREWRAELNPDYKLGNFDAYLIDPDDVLDRGLRTDTRLRKLAVFELRNELAALLTVNGSTMLFRCEVYEGFLALRGAEGLGARAPADALPPAARDSFSAHLEPYLLTSLCRHLQLYGVGRELLRALQGLSGLLYEERKARALDALRRLTEL